MADGRFAPSLIQAWMDIFEGEDKWLALFFSDPLLSDPLTVEVIGGVYVRVNALWSRTTPYAMTLDEDAHWRALPPGTSVAAVGIMTDPTAGVLLAREMIDPVRAYPTGGTFSLNAGEWVVGISVPGA